MKIELRPRGIEEVKRYYERTDDEQISKMLPRSVFSLEQAIENYKRSLLPNATSFGKTIYLDGRHIGDIWSYCMEKGAEPEAMLSFCIFEKSEWGKGIATTAVSAFLTELKAHYDFVSVGAFCYADNFASRTVLEKNGFALQETFSEDGIASCYFEKQI